MEALLAVISLITQLEPIAAEVAPLVEKAINGQEITTADLAVLDNVRLQLEAKLVAAVAAAEQTASIQADAVSSTNS